MFYLLSEQTMTKLMSRMEGDYDIYGTKELNVFLKNKKPHTRAPK